MLSTLCAGAYRTQTMFYRAGIPLLLTPAPGSMSPVTKTTVSLACKDPLSLSLYLSLPVLSSCLVQSWLSFTYKAFIFYVWAFNVVVLRVTCFIPFNRKLFVGFVFSHWGRCKIKFPVWKGVNLKLPSFVQCWTLKSLDSLKVSKEESSIVTLLLISSIILLVQLMICSMLCCSQLCVFSRF